MRALEENSIAATRKWQTLRRPQLHGLMRFLNSAIIDRTVTRRRASQPWGKLDSNVGGRGA